MNEEVEFESEVYSISSRNESNPTDMRKQCDPVFITFPTLKRGRMTESHEELDDQSRKKREKECFENDIEVIDLEDEESVANDVTSTHMENSSEYQEECASDSDVEIDILCTETTNQTTGNSLKKQVKIKRKKQFVCEDCNEVFYHHASLLSHQRLHTGGKVYNCDICTKTFLKYGNFIRHIRTHDTLNGYVCDSCSDVFPSQQILSQHHQNMHEETSKFTCKVCDESFDTFNELKVHKKSHAHRCEDCGKEFLRLRPFIKHQKTHQASHTTDTYSCEECGQAFSHRFALATHRRTHGGRFALF